LEILSDQLQRNKLEILGKLTAGLAHELRNPLSAVKLNMDYLSLIEMKLPPEAKDSVNAAMEALARIQFLIENILSFTRKKQDTLNNSDYSINDITVEVFNILENVARKEGIKLVRKLAPYLPSGNIDKNVFLQIFLNLTLNAIEACEPGKGLIIIQTFLDDDGNIFWEITDNGKGIKEENQKKIFNDFYTSKKEGTGLGLGICKMLLQRCNGELSFESEYGRGTRFSIKLNPVQFQNFYEQQDINNR
jgi:signal transduction histidine kinase